MWLILEIKPVLMGCRWVWNRFHMRKNPQWHLIISHCYICVVCNDRPSVWRDGCGCKAWTLAFIMEGLELTAFIIGPRRFKQGDECLAYRCSPTVFHARMCEVLCLTVCVLSLLWVMACCPVGRKKVWRRQCLLLQRVAIATARHDPHFNYNAACDNPFFCLHFCDVFQVAGEGHHYRSPEFCLPLESAVEFKGKI